MNVVSSGGGVGAEWWPRGFAQRPLWAVGTGWVPTTLPKPELPTQGRALQPWTTPGLFPVYKIGVMMPFTPQSFMGS